MEYIEAKDVVFSYEEQEGESEKIVIEMCIRDSYCVCRNGDAAQIPQGDFRKC